MDSETKRRHIRTLAAWIGEARRTVVLTGAGCSVDSGVPDFRSKSGWWRNIDPRTVATVEALETNYERFHAFYRMRLEHLSEVAPHDGHRVLAEWERQGRIAAIATQNVDGLHQQAGNRNVVELHGSIRHIRCHDCNRQAELAAFMNGRPCGACGGRLRPGVVLFGETLPEEAWQQALADILAADLVLVIGTSLQVHPVNRLPFLTRGRIAILNAEATGEDARFDLVIHGRAKDLLCELNAIVNG